MTSMPDVGRIMAARDPFYLVKEEVESLVNTVQRSVKRWEQLLTGSVDALQLGRDIITDCASIDWQVNELDKAVAVAERDPARYSLDDTEIANRKKWTALTRNQISAIKISVEDSQSGKPGGQREMMQMPLNASSQKMNLASTYDNNFFVAESDRQSLLMKEQDQDLDELSANVGRLGDVGLTIHDELISQDSIIGGIGREMESTANRLDFVQKKVANVIKRAGAKGQIMMIVFLVILLLVLVLLVFS